MSVFLSPGVKTREIDFSTYVGQVSTCIVGMVGGAAKGPIGVPTLITSPSNFIEIFGEPKVDDHGPLSALMFLLQGNQLWYTRVAESTAAEASLTLDGILTITAKEKGTYGNNLAVAISGVNGQDFKLTIYKDGKVSEVFNTTTDETSDYFVGKLESYWVTFETDFSSIVAPDVPLVTATLEPQSLANGNDGLPLTAETIIGVEGLQTLSNPDEIDINVICAPGRFEESVVNQLISIATNRHDCIALIDPPQGLSVQDVIAYHNGTLDGADMPKKALDSSYAAMYYPWVQVDNIYTGKKQWLPPSGLVSGVYAYNDREGQAWFAPAGLNRGFITPALALEVNLNEGDRDALYGNQNAINPIVNYKRQGIVVWGQRTLQRKPSAVDRINVRRLMLLVRKAIAISTAYLVFEQNDPITWRRWTGTIEPFLESIKNSRGLYDYRVVMDETTVTPFYQDRNEMPGQVFLKPTKTAEFIPIDFVLTSTGASFTE